MPGEQQAQQPIRFDQLKDSQDESIKRTAQEIAEITEGNNDSEKKVQLEGILTTEFANTLDPQTANTLLTEAKAAKEEAQKAKKETYTELDDLIAFLKPIANPYNTNNVNTENETAPSNPNNNEEYKTSGFNNELIKDAHYKTLIGDTEELKPIEKDLDNIVIALNHTTTKNIQWLQEFLYNKIDDQQKQNNFKTNNQKNNNRDGVLGTTTKDELTAFLNNTKSYIESYKKHKEIANEGDQQQQQQEIQEATNAVIGLTNPTQESYNAAKQKYDAAKEKYGNSFDLDNKLSQTLNTAGEELQKQQERQKASKSTMTFETLSQKLQTLNNSEINGILAQQIKPLNEKLKQGPSINELNAKISELEGKIKSYDKDNKDKKGNRKAINDLQNELKQVKKEFDNKTDIKEDLSTQLSRIKDIIKKISSPDNTENEIILKNIKDFYGLQNDENTSIIKKENEQGQEQDRTPFSQYERSLDDIGNGKEPSETTQGENTPEQTNQTQTPEQAQKAVNKPRTVNTSLSALFDKVGFKGRDETIGFWKNIGNALGAVFGYYFGFSIKGKESGTKTPEQTNDELKIKLDGYDDNDIKKALKEINNIQGAFNGRQEIVTAINETNNNKKEQQIKNLQRKLRTFPESSKESNIKITGTIDETTATVLQTYAEEQAKQNEQNNGTEMPYAFCEGYTKIDTKIPNAEVYKEDGKNPINYIVIQKDESGNISSITKGQLLNEESVNENTTTIPFNTDSAKIYKLGTGEQATSIVENNYTQQ